MTLTYHDIMHVNLSSLLDASRAWKRMGDKFRELQGRYSDHVRGLSDDSWRGAAFELYGSASDNTHSEFGAAKNEAHAISKILRDAHAQLTDSKGALSDYIEDLRTRGYTVSSQGEVFFEPDGPEEKRSLVQSGSWQAVMDEVADANAEIKKYVKSINEFDVGVKTALEAAVVEKEDKGAPGGFNADAKDVIPEPAAQNGGNKKDKTSTTSGGWHAEGSLKGNGLDAGRSASGVGYGRQGMAKAYIDLAHTTAEGSVSNGDVKLSGLADGYVGGKTSANFGVTESGIDAEAEASGGVRGLAEGRMEAGYFGAYGRGGYFAGAEAKGTAAVGAPQTGLGGKAFAGEKQTAAGGVEAGGIGIGGTAETWEGEGVEAFIGVEKDDNGTWHVGGRAGATPVLPVGGLVGLEITVDPGKVADTAKDWGGAVASGAGKLKDGVTGAF
ncbi:hypothetical protein GCM10009801_75520 [Streptomyces albiaxialis]|uniref:WXG100 family type VII secretion target n=1 Tax=Streptomyces albiaxialis TaxID=329523 RepID=A0ABP5IK00_9ACTN